MEQRQPTPAEKLLYDIVVILKGVLVELQKANRKKKKAPKQKLLWHEPPPPNKYAEAQAEYEARKAQNERELAAEREAKNGVVVDKIARDAAEMIMRKSKRIVG